MLWHLLNTPMAAKNCVARNIYQATISERAHSANQKKKLVSSHIMPSIPIFGSHVGSKLVHCGFRQKFAANPEFKPLVAKVVTLSSSLGFFRE